MNNAPENKRKEGIYTVLNATAQSPLVLDSPHSGRIHPDDFNTIVEEAYLRRTEDVDVDLLMAPAVEENTLPFIKAEFPRSYIDANRAVDDLDEALIEGRWTGKMKPTSRSHNGIGLIRRLCQPDMPMYDRKLSVEEVEHRINAYYVPYHDILKQALDENHAFFGQVWHINCHSMPSSSAPVAAAGPIIHPMLAKADIVIGDRDGTSANLEFTHFVKDSLKQLGYRVVLNNPYKGLEIVKRSGNPYDSRHSIQLEINRAIYVDEQTMQHNDNFGRLQKDLSQLMTHILGYCERKLVNLAAD